MAELGKTKEKRKINNLLEIEKSVRDQEDQDYSVPELKVLESVDSGLKPPTQNPVDKNLQRHEK